jgi:hypothetical protein
MGEITNFVPALAWPTPFSGPQLGHRRLGRADRSLRQAPRPLSSRWDRSTAQLPPALARRGRAIPRIHSSSMASGPPSVVSCRCTSPSQKLRSALPRPHRGWGWHDILSFTGPVRSSPNLGVPETRSPKSSVTNERRGIEPDEPSKSCPYSRKDGIARHRSEGADRSLYAETTSVGLAISGWRFEIAPSGALVAAGAAYQLGTGLGRGRIETLVRRLRSR